jgi:hypothetical protein
MVASWPVVILTVETARFEESMIQLGGQAFLPTVDNTQNTQRMNSSIGRAN